MLMGVRMYETEERAREAASKLVAAGLREDKMYLLTPVPGSEEETVQKAIDGEMLPGRYVHVAVKALRNGRTILSVPLVFEGQKVLNIMDSCGPVDLDEVPEYTADNPSPFSDALGIPTLIRSRPGAILMRNQRHIFTNFFGLPLLKEWKGPMETSFGMPVLLEDLDEPKTHSMGLPLLSKDQGTIFGKFGFKELTEPKRKR